MNLRIFDIIILSLGIISIFFAGFMTSSTIGKEEIRLSLFDKNNDCKGLDLISTSYCLNSEVNRFFKYNISNKNSGNMTIERLKTEGGTCLHWSNYYIDTINNLNFSGERISFYNKNKTTGHAIALVYDENLSYCIIDQKSVVGCN